MKTYGFKLRPLAPWVTPWQADTVFGSLCWELRKLQGEEALARFLLRYEEGEPPFVLSDALPEGWFPRPLYTRLQPLTSLNFKAELPKWIPEQQFCALLREPGPLVPQPWWPELITSRRELHAAIDRSSGTTSEGGNLFEVKEWSFHEKTDGACRNLMLYVRTNDSLDLAAALIQSMAASGFGKKKSVGRGAFEVIGEPRACDWMDDMPAADGFVSLSHFVPHATDPTDGVWSLLTKYPKFAAAAPVPGPFKGRLTMVRPGAAFRVAGKIRSFYGRVLKGVHLDFPASVHYGLAFPVPVRWPKDS
jgi:CRISPR-associated protein Csm4